MKRKLILTIFTAMMVTTMTGCGQKTSDSHNKSQVKQTQESSVSEDKKSNEKTKKTNKTSKDTTGVYPDATGITEINMGIKEDICTFKVPLNYNLLGSTYDKSNQGDDIKGLNDEKTTIEEAIAEGGFSTGNHLASFMMASYPKRNVHVTVDMYSSELMTWDEFKAYYSKAKTIGNENIPALLYHVEKGISSGQHVAVALKLSDDITMQIVYEGSLEKEIGMDELGQRLYNLVTVK